jgi:membrane dipeptidase
VRKIPDRDLPARARALHESAIVIDANGELALGQVPFDRVEPEQSFADAQRSGLTAVSYTAGCWGPGPLLSYENVFADLARWHGHLNTYRDRLRSATCAADIRAAKADGRLAVLFNVQDASILGRDLTVLDRLYGFGVRQVQLTYNSRNLIGDGCTERTDAGLSDFGVAVVRRLNELGVLIELSHCGRQTTLDAAAVSTRPVAAAHTAARALHDVPRAKRDDEMRAMAATGGVVGIVAVPSFITGRPVATIDDVLNHIDHVVNTIGVEHVGIGTDRGVSLETSTRDEYYAWLASLSFKAAVNPPWPPGVEGLACAADLPNLTEGLMRRGYDDDAIRLILGGNFLRLYEQTIG